MNNFKIFAVAIMLLPISSFGQNISNYNNNWVFGQGSHMNFTGGGPTVTSVTSTINGAEGVASISDGLGNLLFYANSDINVSVNRNLYGANHLPMPNGSNLMSHEDASQGIIITRDPENCNQYYVFYASFTAGYNLRYSKVDMTLNGGFGDVIVGQKDVLLYTTQSEQVTIVSKGYSKYFWVITRKGVAGSPSDELVAIELQPGGTFAPPVSSIFSVPPSEMAGAGRLCFNNDYSECVTLSYAGGQINKYNFNSTTGVFSNKLNIANNPNEKPYGGCYNADNTEFFMTYNDLSNGSDRLRIFDLVTNPNFTVLTNYNLVPSSGAVFECQLGPNGLVYINNASNNSLHVVNDPYTYAAPNLTMAGQALPTQNFAGLNNMYYPYRNMTMYPDLMLGSQTICFNTSTVIGGIADSLQAIYSWAGQIMTPSGWSTPSASYLVNPNVTNPTTINLTSTTRFLLTLLTDCGDTILTDKEFVFLDSLSTPVVTGNLNYCAGEPITPLTSTPALAGVINWYTDSGLTTLVGTGTSYTPANTQGSTTYYVVEQESVNNAPQVCNGIVTPVTVTISPQIPLCYTKRAAKWYFGDSLGLNFLCSSPPSILSDGVSSTTPFGNDMECGTTISDVNGNLLFYAHDTKVRNRNHAVMPNGNGMATIGSASQGYLPVPNPTNPNKYYLFHVQAGNGGLFYSEIDLLADAGNGDIIPATKNTLLLDNVGEQLTAVESCVANETWIIVHDLNNIYTFKVTPAGITGPIVSSSPVPMPGISGQMMVSPTGRHIALSFNNYSPCYLFTFDNESGKACYKETLSNGGYGCSFSNNGRYLYTNEFFIGMYQYDVFAPNVNLSAIQIYDPWVGGIFIYGSMHLGPDCKLYTFGQGNLVGTVINNPNNPGLTCNLQSGSFPLSYSTPLQNQNFSATNYIQSWFKDPTYVEPVIDANFTFVTACLPTATNFTNTSTTISECPTYSWNFGDPASGVNNTSTLTDPTHVFSAPGTYNVSLTITERCQTSTEIIPVTVYGAPVVTIIVDTTVCENFGVTLNTSSVGTYLWTGPSGNMSGVFTSTLQNPTNPVFIDGNDNEGWYYLTVTNVGGCSATDSVFIDIIPVPTPNVTSSIANCIQTLTGTVGSSNGPILTHAWGPGGGNSLGTTPNINLPSDYPGPQVVYFVTDSEGCGAGFILLTPPLVQPNVTVGAAIALSCAAPNGIVTASSTTPGATFSWTGPGIVSGGLTSSATVNVAGIYTVTVTNPANGCTISSTVSVTSNSTISAPIIYTPNSWYCVGDNTTPLNSSSGDLWYSNPGLTTLVGNGPSFTPAVINGISTYYVVDTLSGCTSSPTSVTVEFVNCPAPLCGTNLLSNGGFETYTSCPVNAMDLTKAVGWIGSGSYYNTICNGYYNSPAYYPYFNSTNYNVGLNGGGVFPPPSGAGSAGLILGGTMFKNFVTQQVPLFCSKQYTLQFRATTPRSDNSPDNSLCVYGSNTPPPYAGCDPNLTLLACLPSPASINNYWTPQTLTFTPTVNYSYMIITGQCPTSTGHGGSIFIDDLQLCGTCVNSPTIVSVSEIAPETCFGNDGDGTVNATSCASPLSYSWALNSNPGVQLSAVQSPTNLISGSYVVTVTDPANCSSTGNVLINSSSPISAPTTSVTVQPTCTTPTGTIVVTAPLGANLQYSNGGAYQTSTTFTGLASGNYNITAQDMNTGCISTITVLTVNSVPTAPAAPTASVTVQPTCTTPTGTIVVTAPLGANIQYSNGGAYQASTTFSALAPGNYNITAQNMTTGCISTVTVLTVNAVPTAPAAPTASVTVQPTCTTPTGTIVVTAPLGANIQYSNGGAYQASTTFSALTPGNYNITAQNMTTGCISTITVLTVNAVIGAPAVPTASVTVQPTCTNPTGTIVVTAPLGANIQYSNGGAYQASTTFTGLAPGSYNITAQDMTTGCISTITVLTVNTVGAGPTVTVSPDVIINQGTSTTLFAFGADSYSWSPVTGLDLSTGATVIASPSSTTIYCVIGQDLNGCTDTACLVVTVFIECGNLFIPNVFSPNENTLDDELCLFGADCIQGLSFKIYNRWGELIYESNDPNSCWDGMYKEKIVSTGVYAYTLEATLSNGENIERKGNVTVLK